MTTWPIAIDFGNHLFSNVVNMDFKVFDSEQLNSKTIYPQMHEVKIIRKCTLIIIVLIMAYLISPALAYNTAGCMLHVDPEKFNHPHLTEITWEAEISEYDFVPSGSTPFNIRIEFNSVGFTGTRGGICYIGAMIENVGHQFSDDAYGSISNFPALGLYFSSLQSKWPDSSHGVSLNIDPAIPPRFGRVFEDVDRSGVIGKNIYTRENIGAPSISNPIKVKWTIKKGETVTDPQEDLSRNIRGEWVPLVGTFVKWNFAVEINDIPYDVADYYLPIEEAEYISPTDPLVLHQEYFGAAENMLDAQKCTVRYTNIKASDGTNWYDLTDWKLTSRIDDEAGNLDNRFGWGSDGSSLISRVGHEEDVNELSRSIGSTFKINFINDAEYNSIGRDALQWNEGSISIISWEDLEAEMPVIEGSSDFPEPTHFDEGNTRHIMLDIVLGNVMGYYKQQLQLNPNQPDIIEAIRRLESGVTVTNADQFERKIIGTWSLVYKGTDTLIRDNMEIKLSTDMGVQTNSCVSSGGTVVTMMCCKSVADFPNTCVIGPCGCSPTDSKETKVCDCGAGRCFDGTACVATVY